jgi:glycine/sarcosine N-methyltransferase
MTDDRLNTQDFYDQLAGDYDDMIRFQKRLSGEINVLKRWQKRYHFQSALDAGCGSGLHTLALSALGLTATGVDLSGEMIKQARRNARRAGQQNVYFHRLSFSQLPMRIDKQFDAVFCLGNSLAHCLTQEELISALKAFYRLCQAGGLLVVQLLNYEKVLTGKERIIAVNRTNNKQFIRFYDFVSQVLNFNILTIDWEKQAHTLQTTTLYPHTLANLKPALRTSGFVIENTYGSMDFKEYNEKESANLIIVARRK